MATRPTISTTRLLFTGCLLAGTIISGTTVAADTATTASPTSDALAQAGFARFKALDGTWLAESSRGWKETTTFRVMARGSVVLDLTEFADAPEDAMPTVYYLDGGRLLLDHYCMAGNQPRMVATEIADEGARVTFTFLEGTGMASRDQGHMDKAEFHFRDDGTFTSKWTWYQDGQEKWLEDVTHTRIESADAGGD